MILKPTQKHNRAIDTVCAEGESEQQPLLCLLGFLRIQRWWRFSNCLKSQPIEMSSAETRIMEGHLPIHSHELKFLSVA